MRPKSAWAWTRLLTAVAQLGKPLDLTTLGGSRDPGHADTWPEARTVPAAAIRATILRPDLDPHGLQLSGAKIIGQLDLEYATLRCPLFVDRSRFVESIRMEGVIMPALSLAGSHTPGLALGGATINGDLFLDDGFTAYEGVRALDCRVAGQMSLRGATLASADGLALFMDRASITGSLFLDLGFEAHGEVRAFACRVGGQLSLRGATLTNPNGSALGLDRATLGSVFMDEGFVAVGKVSAPGCHVEGQLSLAGASLHNTNGEALSLVGATIGNVYLDDRFGANGAVTLASASIGRLELPAEPPDTVVLSGWRIGDIVGPLSNPEVASNWLLAVPVEQFSVQAWHEVAAVLDRQGRPAAATQLRYLAARQVTALNGELAPPQVIANNGVLACVYRIATRFLRGMYRLFAGYGYYPLWAGAWLVLFTILAGALVNVFGPVGVDPWLFGLAIVVPPMSMIPTSWEVADPLWLVWVLVILKGFGWIQTGILLGGLTGLLKKG